MRKPGIFGLKSNRKLIPVLSLLCTNCQQRTLSRRSESSQEGARREASQPLPFRPSARSCGCASANASTSQGLRRGPMSSSKFWGPLHRPAICQIASNSQIEWICDLQGAYSVTYCTTDALLCYRLLRWTILAEFSRNSLNVLE